MAAAKQSIIVTGGNGFIASHIVSDALEARALPAHHFIGRFTDRLQSGYEVTASVRSEAKAQQLLETHPEWKGRLGFVYISDLVAPNAFDKLFDNRSYDFILHTASPVSFKVDDVKKDLIDPAVQGTLGLLQSAQKLGGPRLKRFVLLGSAVAALDSFEEDDVAGKDYTEDDWNPVTVENATERQDALLGYNASKKYAEKAGWDFMEEQKPAFDLTVINPDIVIGPMLHPLPGPSSINETNKFAVHNFMNGTYNAIEAVRFPFYHFVDVRDVAQAHILAMTVPSAANKRILLVSGLITPQLVANTIREHFPELKPRVSEGTPAQILPKGINPTNWDVSRSREIFGKDWKYRSLEESLVDTVHDILRHEKRWDNKTGEKAAK
ncbi:MAG: hypothetical protein M1817_005108 [Caeruleum heppii]|nr:MAG: hypothetical protein M1817_005108 [Caeruleum heppii]